MEKQKKPYMIYVKYILVVLAVIGVSGAYASLLSGKKKIQAELMETTTKLERLEKKYAKEKSLARNLMGNKQSQEGILRGLEMKIKEAEAATAKIQIEKNSLKTEIAKLAENHKKNVMELTQRMDKMKASRDEVAVLHKEKIEVIRKHEKSIADLNGRIREKENDLKRTTKKLDTCREHNERLCTISEDLVEMYKKKGIVKVFSVTEPLTQLRKVEMEKMVQLYKGKIEKNREKDLEAAAVKSDDETVTQ